MGNMVEVMFLTDIWDNIEKDPAAFVAAIDRDAFSYRRDGFDSMNGVKVLGYHHADHPRVTLSYKNSFTNLTDYSVDLMSDRDLDFLERDLKHADSLIEQMKDFVDRERKKRANSVKG